jgi:hypothetical protein
MALHQLGCSRALLMRGDGPLGPKVRGITAEGSLLRHNQYGFACKRDGGIARRTRSIVAGTSSPLSGMSAGLYGEHPRSESDPLSLRGAALFGRLSFCREGLLHQAARRGLRGQIREGDRA